MNIRIQFLAVLVMAVSCSANAQQKKPNIVFILTDNLGNGEIGCYGGGATRGAATPRIDKLATEGIRLTNMNMETQYTPSRSSLMTGRFAIRSGTYAVPFGGVPDGLTQWEITQRSLSFIEKQGKWGKPFFAYIALTQLHLPTIPNPSFRGKTGNGDWADMLAEIDFNVGWIIDPIDKSGNAENTIIVFTSDNGPEYVKPWDGC